MYETMHRFFPKMNIHLWTNGLKTEEDKALIKDLAKNKNIKVIIVDYPYNFDEAASGKNNQ
jgi:RNase H-fold protein (predicted Holliday junction resolvase)